MIKDARGGVLVLSLFVTLGMGLFIFMMVDFMSGTIAFSRAQAAVDDGLLSAMRIKAKSLETMARRSAEFSSLIHVSDENLYAADEDMNFILTESERLRSGLSGYQGRISSGLTVSMEANGARRETVTQVEPTGLRLELEPRTERLQFEAAAPVDVEGLWYQRLWPEADRTSQALVSAQWNSPWLGGIRTFSVTSSAHLLWDAQTDEMISENHGGFPSDRRTAIEGTSFHPYVAPFYRAQIHTGGSL